MSELADELANALRPFVFDWDQAISEQEDWTEEDHANPELGSVVDRATMERACGALERYERESHTDDLPEGFAWEYREAEDGGGSFTVGPDGRQRGQTILPTRLRRAVGPWEVVRERTVIDHRA